MSDKQIVFTAAHTLYYSLHVILGPDRARKQSSIAHSPIFAKDDLFSTWHRDFATVQSMTSREGVSGILVGDAHFLKKQMCLRRIYKGKIYITTMTTAMWWQVKNKSVLEYTEDIPYGTGHTLCFLRDDVIKWKHFPRYRPFVRGINPAQRPVTRSFDIFFDLRLNKRLSKQSWGWWFETLSCPLWRQCYV